MSAEAQSAAAGSGSRKTKGRKRRIVSSSDIQVAADLPPNVMHPLAGLSARHRCEARVTALGVVLATIARRQSGNGRHEDLREERER